ncbi:Cysteine-rich protein [Spironucleus salmonicida]|uniref:Cysteine-rich protein n=1 Tax=Spironucleus salmonicida TaxID=348837 RepID=V6LNG7_9EUKA|nr:Cysteine-rich protein [Spironucleus salmonicida]|eukprot:EST45261.1 Cysteine-rich protein [Spironucleus salmonicida]
MDKIYKQGTYICDNQNCKKFSYANTKMAECGVYLCPFCREETHVDIGTIGWVCI